MFYLGICEVNTVLSCSGTGWPRTQGTSVLQSTLGSTTSKQCGLKIHILNRAQVPEHVNSTTSSSAVFGKAQKGEVVTIIGHLQVTVELVGK